MESKLILDTKGTCLLCLKEPVTGGGACSSTSDGDGMMSEVSFQNICRYLEINPGFLKGLKERIGPEESVLKNPGNFSVMLCVSCSSLMKYISELIGQREAIDGQLKTQIQELQQVLIKSDEGPEDLWGKFKEKIAGTSGDPVEALMVEHLRHETKQMCSIKVNVLDPETVSRSDAINLSRSFTGSSQNSSAETPGPNSPINYYSPSDYVDDASRRRRSLSSDITAPSFKNIPAASASPNDTDMSTESDDANMESGPL